MKYCKSIVLLFAATVFALSGCSGSSGGGSDGETYEIGDIGPSGVGIVFYVTDGGLHGLEYSPEDIGGGKQPWSNITDEAVVTGSLLPTAIGTGMANTQAIIAQAGHTDSAAQLCRNYRSAQEGDWYLPSSEELYQIYTKLHLVAISGIQSDHYYSSSELGEEYACTVFMDTSLPGDPRTGTRKSAENYVKAVRKF